MRDPIVDRRDRVLAAHPSVAAEVRLDDLLGGAGREGLCGQRGVGATELFGSAELSAM